MKHFVFKSKMANSITVLQVEPDSCTASILFQFSWGKVWSKTIHKVSMQLLKPSPTVCATFILVMVDWIVFDQTFEEYQSLIMAHCVQTKQLIW